MESVAAHLRFVQHGLYVPSDRIVEWFASVGVPNDCRLTLVGNANSFDVLNLVAVVYEDVRRLVNACLNRFDNFFRVMFMPPAMVSFTLQGAGGKTDPDWG
jgi:hypothetical protein